MSELRIMDEELEEPGIEREILETESIKPGSKSICHASVQLLLDHQEIKTISGNYFVPPMCIGGA